MAKRRVAVTEMVFPDFEPARRVLGEVDAEILLAKEPTPEAILKVARDADAIMVTYAKITADMIRHLTQCRIIARTGIGVDNVDIEGATKAGIVVTYVPDYCIDEVSDHALALLLALARKIPYAHSEVHNGQWGIRTISPLHRIRGRVLGLIGFGKIPQALAPKAQALGLEVITYDPYISEGISEKLGVRQVNFEELVALSDCLSIHAPLTSETHYMFNSEVFSKVKPDSLLINTARGALVDIDALVEALDEGRLSGAALDVLPEEPPPDGLPLLGRDDVILTPHSAWYSEEALVELQTKAAKDIVHVLRDEKPIYPINPDILEG